jgi:peptidoglycan hydrolase-like protein with peptidoglycan-binding domain
MTTIWQTWRKLTMQGIAGIALFALTLCFAPSRASAARHAKYAPVHKKLAKHAVRRPSHATTPAKASLRYASLHSGSAEPTTRHHSRYRRVRRHHVTLPKAPSADRTDEIQSALERGGYYSGNPSRRWDANSQAALRRFQEANGLPPTGKLDALSLQKLGLGSDVAGVSAPRPVGMATQPGANSAVPSPSTPKTPGL